jgi:hypothetical protein
MKSYILPLLLLLSIVACKKPNLDAGSLPNAVDPIIFYTSLADTLPSKTYQQLHVDHVTGIKIKDLRGHEVRYFEYQADHQILLRALSHMPFEKYALLSDTVCRRITFNELSTINISSIEREASSFFWNSTEDEYELYACIKSPMKHWVLINRSSRKIIHRIEYIG